MSCASTLSNPPRFPRVTIDLSDEEAWLRDRAKAWGMKVSSLRALLKVGKEKDPRHAMNNPENHHLIFESDKIFLRVRVAGRVIQEQLHPYIDVARRQRDQRLIALGYKGQTFLKQQRTTNGQFKINSQDQAEA